MTETTFVHLRVKSEFSLLEGAVHPKDLAKKVRACGMPAVAVCDSNNLFGVFEITEIMAKEGVQPIVGCLMAFEPSDDPVSGSKPKPSGLPLLVQNRAGYQSLLKVSSASYLEVEDGDWPHITLDKLAQHTEGLIALTGGPGGPVNRYLLDGQPAAAKELLEKLAAAFPGRLYVELQRHGMDEELAVEGPLIDLAYSLDLPLVATNDVHFLSPDMYEAQDALMCIGDSTFVSQPDRRRLTSEHWLKPPEAMAELFSDLPEAVENTLEIAKRCAFRPKKRNPLLPKFEPASGLPAAEELRAQAYAGLKRKLDKYGKYAEDQVYIDRLEFELGIIIKMDFPGYFLIVSDFMKWTRSHGIPVGVRGSGGTSLVAWTLDITNIDPIRFGLLFERFLNPERVSMPDFDIDFCQERREEVVYYVRDKYGAEKVGHIMALGSLQARVAVRDVGRVLQMPLGLIDKIAKMIPNPPGKSITLKEAIAGEPRLAQIAEEEPQVPRLFSIVEKVEGLYRHTSTHPAGVVIGDRPLNELVPLYRDPRSEIPVSQFDYADSEKSGLVKFDFLGLKTLTVIATAQKLIAKRGIELDAQSLDFTDRPTFEMLARGDSVGVFQLESTGMRDLLRKLKPDHINDLVALVALYRPGPMDSIPKYIACKNGQEEPEYLHPTMEPLLKETYGVMTYQEDVMRIARELAGYTLGEADLLRRAMGKKKVEEMKRQRERFLKGAKEKHGMSEDLANQIFDQAAKFAGYGFNKGHAVAYAQVAYQTAYLKEHYPVEFFAASMSLDIGVTDRLNVFRQEAARLGVKVLPPDINHSDATFSCDAEAKVIYYALAAVKGVGRQAMDHVVAARRDGGPFKSVGDFAARVDPRLVNKRAYENLVRAGAFDGLNPNRKQMLESAELVLNRAARQTEERQSGQASLFGASSASQEGEFRLPPVKDWSVHERLNEEFSAIGFYLSGHPLDAYGVALKRLGAVPVAKLQEDRRRSAFRAVLAGTVIHKRERRGRNDQPYAFVTLSDASGMFEVMMFSEVLAQARPFLDAGGPLLITATAEWEGEDLRLRALAVSDLDAATKNAGEGLRVRLTDVSSLGALAGQFTQGGKGLITLIVPGRDNEEVEIALPKRYVVTAAMKESILQLSGVAAVESV